MTERPVDSPPDNEVRLWLARLDDWSLSRLQADYGHWLSIAEQARLHRLQRTFSKRRLLLGRVLMRKVLGDYLGGISPAAVPLVTGPHGRPALAEGFVGADAALGERRLLFNLSHSHDAVLLATATASGEGEVLLGVDIEWIGRARRIDPIARRCFTPDEQQALLALPEAERLEHFYTLWTLKEAYIKAQGLGIEAMFSRPTLPGGPKSPWRFHSLQTPPGYRIGLALSTPKPAKILTPRLRLRGKGGAWWGRRWRRLRR